MDKWQYRQASSRDASALAPLNAALIREEGHRNPMNLRELTERMRYRIDAGYLAAVVEDQSGVAGYALCRHQAEFVSVYQLYVVPSERRQGLARNLVEQIQRLSLGQRLRACALVHNGAGIAFWHAIGFHNYCIGLEREA